MDREKQAFLIKNLSQHFLFLFFFSFVKPYLSPKPRWSLELAWCTCGTSGFCNNQSRGNCAWFAVPCVTLENRMLTPWPAGLPSRAGGPLSSNKEDSMCWGSYRAAWARCTVQRELEEFSEIAQMGGRGNRGVCQKD